MKISKKFYHSPFPRKESNENLFKMSRPIKVVNSEENKLYVEIPPSLTKSYMSKNTLYFDMKNFKNQQTKFYKFKEEAKNNIKAHSINKVRPNSSTNRNKMNINSSRLHCLIQNEEIERLINQKNNLLSDKPKLNPEKDKFKTSSNFNNRTHINKEISKDSIKNILTSRRPMQIAKHKNYGEIPEYINEFKHREIIEKEYERLIKEEKNYPFGTTKLLETERVAILNKLNSTREELLSELQSFPVSSHVRSVRIQINKANVENKLNEVEYAIKIFERNRVYLKS